MEIQEAYQYLISKFIYPDRANQDKYSGQNKMELFILFFVIVVIIGGGLSLLLDE